MMHDTYLAGTLRLAFGNISNTFLPNGSDDATDSRCWKERGDAYFDFLSSGLLFSLIPSLVDVMFTHQSYPSTTRIVIVMHKSSDDAGQLSFVPRSRSYAGLAALPSLVVRR